MNIVTERIVFSVFVILLDAYRIGRPRFTSQPRGGGIADRLSPLVPSLLKDSLFLLPIRQELLLHDGDTSTWAPSCLHPFCQEPWGNRQRFDKIPGKWMALPGAWCVAYLSVVRCIYPAFSLLGSGGSGGVGDRTRQDGHCRSGS